MKKPLVDKRYGPVSSPANKLTEAERTQTLKVANSAEYCNLPPCQIVRDLADQNTYIASEAKFYRVLKQKKQLKHRGLARARTRESDKAV